MSWTLRLKSFPWSRKAQTHVHGSNRVTLAELVQRFAAVAKVYAFAHEQSCPLTRPTAYLRAAELKFHDVFIIKRRERNNSRLSAWLFGWKRTHVVRICLLSDPVQWSGLAVASQRKISHQTTKLQHSVKVLLLRSGRSLTNQNVQRCQIWKG